MPNVSGTYKCWRCETGRVRVVGLACAECLPVLYAEYDRQRAANGGKMLFIPEDWDGPALPLGKEKTCVDCHASFFARGSSATRCEPCRDLVLAVHIAANNARQAERLGRVPRKPKAPGMFDLDVSHVA